MFVIKKGKGILFFIWRCLLVLSFGIWMDGSIVAYAGNALEKNPNVYWTADRMGFTADKGEKDYVVYPIGTIVTVGERKPKIPAQGEHIYHPRENHDISISQWRVNYSPGRCIHVGSGTEYHGEVFSKEICHRAYKCGWLATCADCGEEIRSLFYMDLETARSITKLPGGKDYYYGCPHCGHLEMGATISHVCNRISANKYRVTYRKNARDAEGYMDSSVFYYNNAMEYEGEYVRGETHLKVCGFDRPGYELAGWNTRADGSGQSFTDCQSIYNLSAAQNDEIVLYAQWKRPDSTLLIDPAGGCYEGNSGITVVTKGYGEQYRIVRENICYPEGYQVSFETGEPCTVPTVRSTMTFDSFCISSPFYGSLTGDIYTFTAVNREVDTVTIKYRSEAIILPQAYLDGYIFEGWYLEPQEINKVGNGGDLYTPTHNTILYAKWSEQAGVMGSLTRILEPHEPIFACGESGYVDLHAWGHVNRLEVVFPEEFLKYNSGMNHVYNYAVPEQQKNERLQFMVPLKITQNKEYYITVYAYKDGMLTEDSPIYLWLQVRGSVLDELRTRLR